jgi:hypothetical protein
VPNLTPKNKARWWWKDLPAEKKRDLFDEELASRPWEKLTLLQIAKVVDKHRELSGED